MRDGEFQRLRQKHRDAVAARKAIGDSGSASTLQTSNGKIDLVVGK
jgi:hypothetical protein